MAKHRVIGTPVDINPADSVVEVSQTENGTKKPLIVLVTEDLSLTDVLQLNGDPDVLLQWNHVQFREIPDAIVVELKPENQRAYKAALAQREEERKALGSIGYDVGDQLDRELERHRRIRTRPGWRQTWLSPEDLEAMKAIGAKMIRNPDKDQMKSGYKPGEENGEIKQIMRKGICEQIACEVPESVWIAYAESMAEKSRRLVGATKADAKDRIAEINEQAGFTRKTPGIRAVDRETE